MKKLILFFTIFFMYQTLLAQTYYYELISTKVQGVSQSASGNGHYVTIGNNCCYDSDANGYEISSSVTGPFRMTYKGIQNGEHKYSGNSFWSNSAFYFSNDYESLRVKTFNSGNEFFFRRMTNTGKKSSHKEALEKLNQLVFSTGVSTMPPIVSTGGGSYTSGGGISPASSSSCSGCGGTGICTACRGTGGSWQNTGYYTGSGNKTWIQCGVCNGSGRCGVCHGTGKL